MNRRLLVVAALVACASLVAGCNSKKRHHRGDSRFPAGNLGEPYLGLSGTAISSSTTGAGTNGGSGVGTGVAGNFVQAITPDRGSTAGGTRVVITGRAFVSGLRVELDGVAATNVVVESGSRLRCETPAHAAGAVDVVVTLPTGEVGRINLGFTYEAGGASGRVLARVADHGDPTGEEQELLELINRARKDPVAEGRRLGLDFSGYAARPPLSYNGFLAGAALGHTTDMVRRGFYGHLNPDGVNANGRLLATRYALHPSYGQDPALNLSESIGVGMGNRFRTPQDVHDTFMIDANVNPPKHRNIALGHGGHFPRIREVGMGFRINQTSSQPWEHYVTQEFAFTAVDRPFVTGVAYQDRTPDALCRAGEGRSGVTVTLSHASGFTISTRTAGAGGYAFEVFVDGDYTLEIDGQRTPIQVRGQSLKVDLRDGRIVTH